MISNGLTVYGLFMEMFIYPYQIWDVAKKLFLMWKKIATVVLEEEWFSHTFNGTLRMTYWVK